jgi:hypothetical protein
MLRNSVFRLSGVILTATASSTAIGIGIDRTTVDDHSTLAVADGTLTVHSGSSTAYAIRFSAFDRLSGSSHLNVTRVVIDCDSAYGASVLEFNINSVVERSSRITLHDVDVTSSNTRGSFGLTAAFSLLAGATISNDSRVDIRGGSYTCTALRASASFVYFDAAQLDNASRFDVADVSVNVTAKTNPRL